MVSQGVQMDTRPSGVVAVSGDFKAGRDRLLAFLDKLANKDLLDRAALAAASANIASAMYRVSPTPQLAVLELTTDGGAFDVQSQAQGLVADLTDVDALIARYLDRWSELAAAGRQDIIWAQLGVSQAKPRPAATIARPQPRAVPAPIERPVGVTVVCALQIVFGLIVLVFYLIALGPLLDVATYLGMGGLALLAIVVLLLMIGQLVVVFFVLNGSFIGRRVFAVLVGIGLVIDLIEIFMAPTWTIGINMGLSVVYLAVLYSESANAYFAQTEDNYGVTRTSAQRHVA